MTFGRRVRAECPSEAERGDSAAGWGRAVDYFAVLVFACFGFFGVFAFLSMRTSCGTPRAVAVVGRTRCYPDVPPWR
jgi:hypothetical protein